MQAFILILGGTTEARELAMQLAPRGELAPVLSLAGRTLAPLGQGIPVRRGGFGGVAGLVRYLRENTVSAVIDATHPYASTISAHAAQAAARTKIPLLALRRPPWRAIDGDRWTVVRDAEDAMLMLGSRPQNVFLALGRQELAPFRDAPQHGYLIRSVDPVEPMLAVPRATYIRARGPFPEEAEYRLLRTHAIDVVVAKNSGGEATYGKIAAARRLGIRVVLLRRPSEVEVTAVASVAAALAWLNHVVAAGSAQRGV